MQLVYRSGRCVPVAFGLSVQHRVCGPAGALLASRLGKSHPMEWYFVQPPFDRADSWRRVEFRVEPRLEYWQEGKPIAAVAADCIVLVDFCTRERELLCIDANTLMERWRVPLSQAPSTRTPLALKLTGHAHERQVGVCISKKLIIYSLHTGEAQWSFDLQFPWFTTSLLHFGGLWIVQLDKLVVCFEDDSTRRQVWRWEKYGKEVGGRLVDSDSGALLVFENVNAFVSVRFEPAGI